MNVASLAGLKVRVFDPASGAASDIAGVISHQTQEPAEVVTRNVNRIAFEGWMATYGDHHDAASLLREVSDEEADAIDAKLPPYHRSGGRVGI